MYDVLMPGTDGNLEEQWEIYDMKPLRIVNPSAAERSPWS